MNTFFNKVWQFLVGEEQKAHVYIENTQAEVQRIVATAMRNIDVTVTNVFDDAVNDLGDLIDDMKSLINTGVINHGVAAEADKLLDSLKAALGCALKVANSHADSASNPALHIVAESQPAPAPEAAPTSDPGPAPASEPAAS